MTDTIIRLGQRASDADDYFDALARLVDSAGPSLTSAERLVRYEALRRSLGELLERNGSLRFRYQLPDEAAAAGADIHAIVERGIREATEHAVARTVRCLADVLQHDLQLPPPLETSRRHRTRDTEAARSQVPAARHSPPG